MRNLLTLAAVCFGVAGCKKPAAKPTVAETPPTTAVVTGTATPVPNTNYDPNAGVGQNVRNAIQRTVTLAEMTNLGLMIEVDYTLNNKMPQLNTVMATLRNDAPQVAKAIDDKKIILCWTAEHQGLWAYEAGADTQGGIVLVSGVARRAEAEEVQRLLQR